MVSNARPAIPTSPPECEQFRGDVAVFVIGALEGDERCRLLRHLDSCPHCDSLREELSEIARALEGLRPLFRAGP
jgi:hypothetical protein